MALILLIALVALVWATDLLETEPIKPIPQKVEYDKKKAKLGKLLFHDPILSKNKTVSCATCHDLYNKWGTDHREASVGINGQSTGVNAPSVFNAVFNFRQFWDGRARDLREQALGPIHNPKEMGMTKEEVERRLNENPVYRKLFKEVYGTDRITFDQVIDAIVEFEKALITPNSKFDRFLRGEIELSKEELEGYKLFKRLGCISCHNGINVGGNSFQLFGAVIPVEWKPSNPDRYRITGREFDKNRYKVPSLRNVACTYPYFHDGSAKTLEEAVRKMSYHNLGYKLSEDEVRKIVAFLKTLTGELPEILKE